LSVRFLDGLGVEQYVFSLVHQLWARAKVWRLEWRIAASFS
jgi:hypothetical protein